MSHPYTSQHGRSHPRGRGSHHIHFVSARDGKAPSPTHQHAVRTRRSGTGHSMRSQVIPTQPQPATPGQVQKTPRMVKRQSRNKTRARLDSFSHLPVLRMSGARVLPAYARTPDAHAPAHIARTACRDIHFTCLLSRPHSARGAEERSPIGRARSLPGGLPRGASCCVAHCQRGVALPGPLVSRQAGIGIACPVAPGRPHRWIRNASALLACDSA